MQPSAVSYRSLHINASQTFDDLSTLSICTPKPAPRAAPYYTRDGANDCSRASRASAFCARRIVSHRNNGSIIHCGMEPKADGMVEKRDGQTRLLGKWHNEIVSGRNVHECGFSLKGLLSQELFALCLHRAYLYVFVRFGCVSLLLVSLKWVINISHLIRSRAVWNVKDLNL